MANTSWHALSIARLEQVNFLRHWYYTLLRSSVIYMLTPPRPFVPLTRSTLVVVILLSARFFLQPSLAATPSSSIVVCIGGTQSQLPFNSLSEVGGPKTLSTCDNTVTCRTGEHGVSSYRVAHIGRFWIRSQAGTLPRRKIDRNNFQVLQRMAPKPPCHPQLGMVFPYQPSLSLLNWEWWWWLRDRVTAMTIGIAITMNTPRQWLWRKYRDQWHVRVLRYEIFRE